MNWQPIETAPRDGTNVDMWCIGPPAKRFKMAYRVTNIHTDGERDVWWDGDWHPHFDAGNYGVPTCWFSHWMPLPEPPK